MSVPELGSILAVLNASLNGASALLLVSGFVAVKRRRVDLHWKFMVSAFGASVLFLISYLTRFYLTGVHRYPGEGADRIIYLGILSSHTVLAAVTPFLAIRTLYLAVMKRFEEHRRMARVTLPIWFTVSVTGVIIYLMLYHFS